MYSLQVFPKEWADTRSTVDSPHVTHSVRGDRQTNTQLVRVRDISFPIVGSGALVYGLNFLTEIVRDRPTVTRLTNWRITNLKKVDISSLLLVWMEYSYNTSNLFKYVIFVKLVTNSATLVTFNNNIINMSKEFDELSRGEKITERISWIESPRTNEVLVPTNLVRFLILF